MSDAAHAPRPSLTGDSRRDAILQLVEREGQVLTSELAQTFSVSLVTVHRDLQYLAAAGLIDRVHGGARPKARRASLPPTDWTTRLGRREAAKDQIGRFATSRIEDGSTVFIDASSTCLAMTREIARRPPAALTVVTNSPVIAAEFREESVHIVVTPGEVDQNLRFIAGPWTVEFIAGLRFQRAFVSAGGLTLQQGLGTTRRPLADLVQVVRRSAQHLHALIDSSKFGAPAMLSMLDVRDTDEVVVDDELPSEVRDEYVGAGVNIVVAHERPSAGEPRAG